MKTHSHKNHEEVRQCAISFGPCWHVKGRRDKQNNKPHGTQPNDIEFYF